MKIVIDIPKYIYKHAKEQSEDNNDEWDAMRAIANGTPLPKGHGRLIDADALLKEHRDLDAYPFPSTTIQNAPTIIEAEEE